MEKDIQVHGFTRFYILILLKSNESVTGYFILKRLQTDLKINTSPALVYKFLKELNEKGYIKEIDKKDSKRSKGYRLTNSGANFIDRIFLRFDNLIEAAIESKLKICSSCGVKLYGDFYTEAIHGKELNFCCSHCAKAYKDLIHSNQ